MNKYWDSFINSKLGLFSLYTCGSVRAFFATPRPFGNDDLFKVAQLCQVGGDAADLCFGALLPRAVDRRGGE